MQLYSFEFSRSSFAGWQFPEFHTSIPFIRPGRHRYIQLASYVYMCAACVCIYSIYIYIRIYIYYSVESIQTIIHTYYIHTFKEETTIFTPPHSCLVWCLKTITATYLWIVCRRELMVGSSSEGRCFAWARLSVDNNSFVGKVRMVSRVKIWSSDSEGYLFSKKNWRNDSMMLERIWRSPFDQHPLRCCRRGRPRWEICKKGRCWKRSVRSVRYGWRMLMYI